MDGKPAALARRSGSETQPHTIKTVPLTITGPIRLFEHSLGAVRARSKKDSPEPPRLSHQTLPVRRVT